MNVQKRDDIFVYEKAIHDDFCELLIREFHKGFSLGEVIDGHVSSEGVAEYKSDVFLVSKDIHFFDHERWDKLNAKLHRDYILPVLRHYLNRFRYVLEEESLVDPESCIMSLYEKRKGKFAPHQDSVGGLVPQRSLTIIAYLNSVSKGGETEFFNQEYSVKPQRGSVLIFPSNFVYAHKGNVPVSNDKYITVSFASVDIGLKDKLDHKSRN